MSEMHAGLRRLIITFHYVRPSQTYHCVTPDEFGTLLDWLRETFSVVTLQELRDSLDEDRQGGKPLCCLTFDDGLQDHFQYVFPELTARNLQANFFLSPMPYVDNRPIDIHVTHALQFELGEQRFGQVLQSKYQAYGIDIVLDGEALGPKYSKWASPLLSNIKVSLKQLNPVQRRRILHELFQDHLGDLDEFRASTYLSREQIREMEDASMRFGNHGFQHEFLATMTSQEQETDIRTADSHLAEMLQQRPDTISYPFGSFNEDTLQVCRAMNFQAGVTVIRGDNPPASDPLTLRRMDVKEVFEFMSQLDVGASAV